MVGDSGIEATTQSDNEKGSTVPSNESFCSLDKDESEFQDLINDPKKFEMK